MTEDSLYLVMRRCHKTVRHLAFSLPLSLSIFLLPFIALPLSLSLYLSLSPIPPLSLSLPLRRMRDLSISYVLSRIGSYPF